MRSLRKIILMMVATMLFVHPAYGEVKGIAELASFTGKIMMKSLGSWGVTPQKGMPLYPGDKILTKDGSASVLFHDGSTLDVRPNSNVRIIEKTVKKGLLIKKDVRQRNIRTLTGKIEYKSVPSDGTDTVLVSSTAVAALRGTEVWFGSDGKHAYLEQTEGESDKDGNITEGYVPEITPEQALNDPNHQAALKAMQNWQNYNKFGTDMRASWLLGKRGINRAIYLGYLAKYVQASAEELLAENSALTKNPNGAVTEGAQKATEKVESALLKAEESLNQSAIFEQKVEDWKALQADHADSRDASLAYSKLIEAGLECNRAYEYSTLIRALLAEAYTSNIPSVTDRIEDILKIAEVEQAALAAMQSYKNTESFVSKVLNDDAPETNLILAAISAAVTGSNAEMIRTAVNAVEAAMTSGDMEAITMLADTMKNTMDIRDQMTRISNDAEAKTGDLNALEADQQLVAQMLQDIESSAYRYQLFSVAIERASLVLPLPKPPASVPQETEGKTADDAILMPEVTREVNKDRDGDGWTEARGDCDDTNPLIHPGANDICEDGIDQNCDGSDHQCSDDGNDHDGDGYTGDQGDCNDADASIHPGAAEICGDGIDQNCDGSDLACSGGTGGDDDDDTPGDIIIIPLPKDNDGDGYTQDQGDCNDADAGIHPGAAEICGDGIDQNCDGSDLACSDDTDKDGDGYTKSQGDCNDNYASIHPGATEICGDGIDQNCDGKDVICPEGTDKDGDGYTKLQGDCNDNYASIHPGATEICGDGIDQNCDGKDVLCSGDTDNDGDGYTENQGDRNDNNAAIHPGATEICGDGIDQDCDGYDLICDPSDIDNDRDGFTENMGDCNDADPTIYPGAVDICGDHIDQDCENGDWPCPYGQ